MGNYSNMRGIRKVGRVRERCKGREYCEGIDDVRRKAGRGEEEARQEGLEGRHTFIEASW